MELLFISSYPEKFLVHGTKTVGVASYTKNTLLHLKKIDSNLKIKVLAEILGHNEAYSEGDVDVDRIWRRNDMLSIFGVFVKALFSSAKIIVIPFEIYVFGSITCTFLGLILPLLLKVCGKRVVFILHQVPAEFSSFSLSRLKYLFFTIAVKLFYSFLTLSSSLIVVFEDEFKRRIGKGTTIIAIPHAVEDKPLINMLEAKKALGLNAGTKYVLYFGFLSPYKGLEDLLQNWKGDKDLQLILAGGGNPNHLEDSAYKSYVGNIIALAQSKDVLTTGFLSEEKIAFYYSACDLVVLPYKGFMSSSGPLSLAFSYEKPVLLSKALSGYFNSPDFLKVAQKHNLTAKSICSDFKSDLNSKILWALENKELLKGFSKEMKYTRSWNVIGNYYLDSFQKLLK